MNTFKGIHAALLLTIANCLTLPGQSSYTVTERGADYRVWQKTAVENGTNRVHCYTELAAGMHYLSNGQWVESQEQIAILPQGGAAAVQGRHQVYFPGDIGSGVLKVVTLDGRVLQSRPLGVTYDDGKSTAFIGLLTNSAGWLTASNQVTYRNCFTGINADLVCTYRRGGLPGLFIVHWNAATTNFVITQIPQLRYIGGFEHSTFAPMDIPPVTP